MSINPSEVTKLLKDQIKKIRTKDDRKLKCQLIRQKLQNY